MSRLTYNIWYSRSRVVTGWLYHISRTRYRGYVWIDIQYLVPQYGGLCLKRHTRYCVHHIWGYVSPDIQHIAYAIYGVMSPEIYARLCTPYMGYVWPGITSFQVRYFVLKRSQFGYFVLKCFVPKCFVLECFQYERSEQKPF